MYYQIKDTLEKSDESCINDNETQFVAVLTFNEWEKLKNSFDMGIDFEPYKKDIVSSVANVNYDSITGTFCILDRHDFSKAPVTFAYALDEKGIVFIDDDGNADEIINYIRNTRKWKLPSLERFLYDFLNYIVRDDLELLKSYERRMEEIELAIMNDESPQTGVFFDIRSNIRDLRNQYGELRDIVEVFEENDNDFFKDENIRYFQNFLNHLVRLFETTASIRDYNMQIRDTYKMGLEIKQNNIMTILTIITTVFMPLTLIVGWYGMNFKYMPELDYFWSYPIVFIVSLLIVIVGLAFFKRKNWL